MLNVSTQAYFYTIIFLITSVINIICSGVLFGAIGFFMYLFLFVIMIPFILLNIYNIDCLTSGNCQIWSWINSVLASLGLFSLTILIILAATIKTTITTTTSTTTTSNKEENK